MTVSNNDLSSFIDGDLRLSTTEIHSIAVELQRFRMERERRKRVPEWRCSWCGKERSTKPEWEQEHNKDEWLPLCGYCARKRLNNPLNFLLNMRRIDKTKNKEVRE